MFDECWWGKRTWPRLGAMLEKAGEQWLRKALEAQRELALAIHLGRLAPGAPLREVEIAEANSVSRTIVRAALQRLEAQGLAEITLNKGARVRQPDAVAA